MATDNTHVPQREEATTSPAQEYNPQVVEWAQADALAGGTGAPAANQAGNQAPVIPAAPNGEVKIDVPAGQTVVRVQVAPGETIDLPFDGAMAAKFGQEGNLAIKVGDQTVILLGYGAANQQAGVTLHDHKGQPIDVATVVAQTDPNLDIQTAAGPAGGPAGGQGGHLFFGFAPNGGLGGLGELGVINPTDLQYKLIQPDEQILVAAPTAADTSPVLVNITATGVVNEDDLHHSRQEESFLQAEVSVDQNNPASPGLVEQLQNNGNFTNAFFTYYDQGNDPFDTTDHEAGSQSGAPGLKDDTGAPDHIDQDREPLVSQATVTVNFFADLPGAITFDNNGQTPIIDALVAQNLTSYGHPLQYALLPATATHGESIVGYVNLGEGEAQAIIFSLEIEETQGTSALSDFHIDFTLFGNLDNGVQGTGVLGEDMFNLDALFFMRDSNGSVTESPAGALVFHAIDDVPQLGAFEYGQLEGAAGPDTALVYDPANLTLGIDEHKGQQQTDYQADVGTHDKADIDPAGSLHQQAGQQTDDVNLDLGTANSILHDALTGASDVPGYAAGVLAHIDTSYFIGGDPANGFADMIGVAQNNPSYWQSTNGLNVSFGADGEAVGNQTWDGFAGKAGTTLFDGDAATSKATGFELYMQNGAVATGAPDGTANNAPTDAQLTNLTISYEKADGTIVHLAVTAYQLDANTIIGVSAVPPAELKPSLVETEGAVQSPGGIPVFALHLDASSGQMTLVQYHQVDNLDADGNPTDLTHLLTDGGNQLLHFRATDFDGDFIDAPLEITFTDDVPTAQSFGIPDQTEHTPTVDLGTVAAVFGAHYDAGTDGLKDISILTPGDATHGTLEISNGHVFYTPPSDVKGDQTFTFSYQVTDADGDTATATISVLVKDNVPTITQLTPEGHPGEVTVFEAGLGDGSGIGNTAIVAAGAFKIDTHGEGLGSLSIGGGTVDLNAGFPQIVHSDSLGALAVTGISNVSGVYTVSYSYTLDSNYLENPAANNGQDVEKSTSFSVDATDASGDPASSNLTVHIVDDNPTASSFGIGSFDEHSAQVDLGTVASVFAGHYVAGADGLGSLVITTPGDSVQGSLEISGGHVYYTPPANVTGDQSFNFNYQVTDADGDVATAVINVDVIDHVPTITQLTPERTPGEVTVYEAGLGSGSGIGDTTTTATGSFKIDTHGEGLGTLSIGGGAVDLGAGFPQAVHSDSLGDLKVTGISVVGGIYTVSYSYTLDSNYLETPASNNGQDIETSPSFVINATDASGDPVASNITVHVVDDVPVASADAFGAFTAQTAAGQVIGNILTNDNPGADGFANPKIVGVVGGVAEGSGFKVDTGDGIVHIAANGAVTFDSKSGDNYGAGKALSFTYTIEDKDGDTSTATATLTVKNPDLPTPPSAPDEVVNESQLASGNKLGGGSITDSHTFTLPAGFTVNAADLGAHTLPNGTLTISQVGSTVTYAFTLSSAYNDGTTATSDGQNLVNAANSYTVHLDGPFGQSVSVPVNVDIKDDVPVASADAFGGFTAQTAAGQVIGNILTNDNPGADGYATPKIVGVVGGVAEGSGFKVDTGDGVIHISASGAVTFDSKSGDNYGAGKALSFTYTIEDKDGDTSTATATLSVKNPDLPTPPSAPDEVVNESQLASGNKLGGGSITDSHTFQLPAGFTVTAADLGAHTLPNGTLTISQVGSTVTYAFTLSSAYNDGTTATSDGQNLVNAANSYTVHLDGPFGQSVSVPVNIDIKDDVPVASADTGSVNSGATLNVLVGAGVEANDHFGADGKSGSGVVGVRLANGDTTTAVQTGTGSVIHGTYGDLTLAADGSYSYKANANASGVDHFVYTIKDADGDLSTTTLDITVNRTGPNAASGSVTVYEAALDLSKDGSDLVAGTVTGSNPSSTNETASSSLGLPSGVTVQNAGTFALTYGTLKVNVDGTFTYTLSKNYLNPTANDGNQLINGVDSKVVTIVDALGNTNTATITINAWDDKPTVSADFGTVFDSANHLTDSGNVLTGAGEVAGGADNLGADGGVVYQGSLSGGGSVTTIATGVAGSVIHGAYGDLTLHQDGSYSYAQTTAAPNNVAAEVFNYTVKDGDGDRASTTLTINLAHAPSTSSTDGSSLVQIENLSLSNNPDGDASVGNYLLNTNVEGHAITPSLINGVDPANLKMNVGSDVQVTFEREGAGYHNMVGVYSYDSAGNIIPGSVHFIWLDASQNNQNVLHNALTADFLGNGQPLTVDLGNYPAGTNLGFFLVVDGASNSHDTSAIKSATGNGGHGYATDLATLNAQTSIVFDANGHGHVVVNGTKLNSDVIFTSNTTWNTYNDSGVAGGQHALSGVSTPADGNLYVGFEDQNLTASDHDYNDVVFGVNLGSQNISKIDQQIYNPNVSLGDIDGDIAQVTILTSGFLSGDSLNHLASGSGFNVAVTHTNNDYAVTITETTSHTTAQWQSFVDGIDFSSTSTVEGQRGIQYTVTDVSGFHASTTAHVDVTTLHQESLSEMTDLLHNGNQSGHNNTWGSGDDTVYLDQNFVNKDGILDMAGGNNTLHIGANGLDITSTDAAHLKNVDHIDMTGYNGGGGNAATLSFQDVINVTDSNHQLKIDGDSGDKVTLNGDAGAGHWHQAADTTVAGETYHQYDWHGSAGNGVGNILATVLVDEHLNQVINDKA
jgi:VCBS repeat-containing protein